MRRQGAKEEASVNLAASTRMLVLALLKAINTVAERKMMGNQHIRGRLRYRVRKASNNPQTRAWTVRAVLHTLTGSSLFLHLALTFLCPSFSPSSTSSTFPPSFSALQAHCDPVFVKSLFSSRPTLLHPPFTVLPPPSPNIRFYTPLLPPSLYPITCHKAYTPVSSRTSLDPLPPRPPSRVCCAGSTARAPARAVRKRTSPIQLARRQPSLSKE